MNFRIISVLAIFGMLNLTSCMQDQPNPSDVQKEIKVSASIEGATNVGVKTRVTGDSWNDGDAIGIFMKKSESTLSLPALAENAKYVNTGSSGFFPAQSNEIYFPFNDDKVDFIAYYPHTNLLDDLNYLVDVSDQSYLSDIDLLYSNNANGINASNGEVNLTFKHQLSKIILNISMADDSDYDLTGLKAEITNVNTKASFSLVNGELSIGSEPKGVSFNMSEDGKSAQAILLPTTSLDSMILVLTLDCISYSFNLAISKEISSFDKSTKHILNVTLKPGDDPKIESMTATIEDWIDGKTEDLIAEENSTYTPPGKPGEGDGDNEEDLNGGEDDQYVGDGSKDYPYTVTQAKEITSENRVWVKGYIVGYYALYTESSLNEDPINQNNVAIADSSIETIPEQTFRIDLDGIDNVVNPINLKNNPENKSKMAYFCGDIVQSKNISVLKNVTEAFIVNNTSEE